MSFSGVSKAIYNGIFSYSTIRQSKIHSFKIALLFRIIQISIIGYIVGWSIVYKKGYQEIDSVSSSVSTKVKGLGYIASNSSQENFTAQMLMKTSKNFRIFDVITQLFLLFDLFKICLF